MKKLPARVTATFGIHVRGTPLWIDATRRKELCVVTGIVARLPPAHTRLVATPELANVLHAAGHASQVLATPRERWVGVGGEQVQLVDCGAGNMSAAAVVRLREETVLVTGPLRATPVDWPRADHVIAHVPALLHQGHDLAVVVDTIVRVARDARCSVRAETLEVAVALERGLRERGIAVKGRGLVAAVVGRASNVAVAVGAQHAAPKPYVDLALTRIAHGPGHRIDINTGLGTLRGADAILPLHWFADSAGIAALVASVGPKRLTLVGPRVSGLTAPTEVVWHIEPTQLSLSSTQRVEN